MKMLALSVRNLAGFASATVLGACAMSIDRLLPHRDTMVALVIYTPIAFVAVGAILGFVEPTRRNLAASIAVIGGTALVFAMHHSARYWILLLLMLPTYALLYGPPTLLGTILGAAASPSARFGWHYVRLAPVFVCAALSVCPRVPFLALVVLVFFTAIALGLENRALHAIGRGWRESRELASLIIALGTLETPLMHEILVDQRDNHNLWPFEVIETGILGGIVAITGWRLGLAIKRGNGPRRDRRPPTTGHPYR